MPLPSKKIFSHIVNFKRSGVQRRADLCFELLLCELSEHHLHSPETELAAKLKTIIHGNPEKFFSNLELANMLGVSVKTAET